MRFVVSVVSLLVAIIVPVDARLRAAEFELLDHCDAREFPASDGELVPHTDGCTAEGAVIGDWYLAEIVQGDVGPPIAVPFAFGTREIINRRTIGFFAHHLTDPRQAYCKIPVDMQQSWDDFEFFVVARDEIGFSCVVEQTVKYGRWKLGTDPELIDPAELPFQVNKLPVELRSRKLRHQISDTTWYKQPSTEQKNVIQVTAMQNGGFLCLSKKVGIFGQLEATTPSWKWQLSVDDFIAVVGEKYRKLSVPALIPPVSDLAIAVESDQGKGQVDVLLLESGELRVIATMPAARLHSVHASPNQRYVLVQYRRNRSESITEFLHRSLIDVQAKTATKLTFMDDDLHVINGIDDTGRIITTGGDHDILVTNRITPTPAAPAIAFDILLPAKD